MLTLKARARVPMVTTFYGADATQLPRNDKWRQAYRRLFEEGELFLAEGNVMREHLIALGCPPEKVLLQRIGIPLDAFPFCERRPDASGCVRVLVAAVFREKKGIPYALRAVERVRQRHPELTVTLLGDSAGKARDDEEKEKILALVARLGEGVRWLGFQPYQAYKAALREHDIFLSPSVTADDGDSEGGAPISLIEAQATGMPVISTFHADIPEIVMDGQTGLLSPERDVEALATSLERVVSDHELASRLGRAGRAHVESNHNIRVQVRRLEEIYAHLTRCLALAFACLTAVAA
jgi:colanic acid/amylovoran biosynthesis glycosyltransferase